MTKNKIVKVKSNSNISLPRKLKKLSLFFSIIVAMVGFIVLLGWIGNIPILKSILPNWISMKVDTALCFLLSGITLILLIRERPGRIRKILIPALSLIIILIGTVSLLEYIFHFNAGIDEFFFKDDIVANGTASPGRPAIQTAFCFILFGLSFLFGGINRSYLLIFQWLNIAAGFIALIGLLGYLFGVEQLSGISEYTTMAAHTSFTFLLLMEASLLIHPDKGIMKLPSSNTLGGRLIRNSFPIIIGLIIIMGWLRFQGELAGLYDTRSGVTILIISIIIVFTVIIFSNAILLNNKEEKLNQLSQAVEQSPTSVVITDTKGNIQYVNQKFLNVTGYSVEEVMGKNPRILKSGHTTAIDYANLWKQIASGLE